MNDDLEHATHVAAEMAEDPRRGIRHRPCEDELRVDEDCLRESIGRFKALAESDPRFAAAYADLQIALALRAVAVEIELAGGANAVRTVTLREVRP